eukprot:4956243-Pyramimonas_sp.AAC.1
MPSRKSRSLANPTAAARLSKSAPLCVRTAPNLICLHLSRSSPSADSFNVFSSCGTNSLCSIALRLNDHLLLTPTPPSAYVRFLCNTPTFAKDSVFLADAAVQAYVLEDEVVQADETLHTGVPSKGDDKTLILGEQPPPHINGIRPMDERQTENVVAIAGLIGFGPF